MTPKEALEKSVAVASGRIPKEIIEIVDEMIVNELSKPSTRLSYIYIRQDKIIQEVLDHKVHIDGQLVTRNMIFDNNWLDIEEYYRHAGWSVEYNKPAYYEDWGAHFIFDGDQ